MKPIRFDVLREFSQAKIVRELIAQKPFNGIGYHLIARTQAGDRILVTNRSTSPRQFKTLDAVAIEADKLSFTGFSVVGFGPLPRSLRQS